LEKIRAGEKIYNLSAGEPMMPAPQIATHAFIRSLKEEKTHYPPVSGIPELRQIAAKWMNELYGSKFKKENTLVVNGGKFGIFILLQALLKPGYEVLIPAPYWVSYPNMVQLFKGIPTIIESSQKDGWKITPKDIIKKTSKKTKILILNNAGNPTGALYSKTEIKNILAIAFKLGLFVISDEVYNGLVYDNKTFVSCSSFNKFRKNVAVIQSCSKNFAMTGFRVGFIFASKEIIKILGNLVSQSTSGVTTMCQYATVAVIKDAKRITRKINIEMKKRRNIFVSELNKAFNCKIAAPESGLYVFVPLSTLGWKGGSSNKFSRLAIEKPGVATVPGSAFGKEGYVRFSFGERPKIIKEGIYALAKWIKSI
jgi:aspartate/methionine/tyrosine aminotransferase